MLITYCNNVYEPHNMIWIELWECLESIRDCRFKELVDDAKGSAYKKRNLPAFAFSTFNNSVKNANLLNHSGLFHYDIDGVSGHEIREKVQRLPYTYATWLSPNGGLKGLMKIERVASDAEYKLYFARIQAIFEREGVKIDQSCKDIRRFCFVSYDANLWVNEDCEKLVVEQPIATNATNATNPTLSLRFPTSHTSKGTVSHNVTIEERIKTILYNCQPGNFHSTRFRIGVIIGGLIAGNQADDGLIDAALEWSSIVHSTFGDSESIVQRETKAIYDGLAVGKCRPIYDDFLKK